jgi:hypothetical protein
MDDARKDNEFEAGFYEDFDRLGEEAVSRHLSSGSFSVGKAEMARIWLDRKLRGAAKRAEARANIAIAISMISAATAMIAAAAAIIRH